MAFFQTLKQIEKIDANYNRRLIAKINKEAKAREAYEKTEYKLKINCIKHINKYNYPFKFFKHFNNINFTLIYARGLPREINEIIYNYIDVEASIYYKCLMCYEPINKSSCDNEYYFFSCCSNEEHKTVTCHKCYNNNFIYNGVKCIYCRLPNTDSTRYFLSMSKTSEKNKYINDLNNLDLDRQRKINDIRMNPRESKAGLNKFYNDVILNDIQTYYISEQLKNKNYNFKFYLTEYGTQPPDVLEHYLNINLKRQGLIFRKLYNAMKRHDSHPIDKRFYNNLKSFIEKHFIPFIDVDLHQTRKDNLNKSLTSQFKKLNPYLFNKGFDLLIDTSIDINGVQIPKGYIKEFRNKFINFCGNNRELDARTTALYNYYVDNGSPVNLYILFKTHQDYTTSATQVAHIRDRCKKDFKDVWRGFSNIQKSKIINYLLSEKQNQNISGGPSLGFEFKFLYRITDYYGYSYFIKKKL